MCRECDERESWTNKNSYNTAILTVQDALGSGAYIIQCHVYLFGWRVCKLKRFVTLWTTTFRLISSFSPSKQWLRSRLQVVEHGMFGLPVQTSWHVQILKEDLVIFVTTSQATIPQMVKTHENYTSFAIYNKSCKWCC